MNLKKIVSAVLAIICIAGMPAFLAESRDFSNIAYAEGTEDTENNITINCVGEKAPITINGTTESPKWQSEDESIAKVVSTGEFTADIIATGKGSTSVVAVFSNQILRFNVTVIKENSNDRIEKEMGTFTLTNAQPAVSANMGDIDSTDFEWSSTDENVAKVNEKGEIFAVGKGECEIRAIYGDYVYIINIISEYAPQQTENVIEQFISEIQLTNTDSSKKINVTLPEGATIEYSSTDETVAVVSADGIVTAKGSGKCRIYAVVGNVRNYFEVISTYTGVVLPDKPEDITVTLTVEEQSKSVTLTNASADSKITWSTSDKSVAYVTDKGVIIAMGKGECVITATAEDKIYKVKTIVDIPDNTQLEATEIKGTGKTASLEIGDKIPTFISSDESVAIVDEKGNITSVGIGTALIIVDYGDALTFLRVNVTPGGTLIGDANCDGKITLADATAILQSIANPDKYGLSETGQINGNVDGNEGITTSDAIVIRLYYTKVINTLPYIEK